MSETHDTNYKSTTPQPSNALLLGGPEDVVRHPMLTVAEKRHVLARWASDAHAVENLPALRQLDDGSVVRVDEILGALKALDGNETPAAAARRTWHAHERRRSRLLPRLRMWRRRWDGDDDPPPPPAVTAFPIRFFPVDGVAA